LPFYFPSVVVFHRPRVTLYKIMDCGISAYFVRGGGLLKYQKFKRVYFNVMNSAGLQRPHGGLTGRLEMMCPRTNVLGPLVP